MLGGSLSGVGEERVGGGVKVMEGAKRGENWEGVVMVVWASR